MRQTAKMYFVASSLALLTTLAVSATAMGQDGPGAAGSTRLAARASNQRVISIEPVLDFADTTKVVPGSGSVLIRTNEGVYMSLHTFGLTPGDAVTAWWAFFNNPKKCATSPCTPADLSNPEAEPSLVNATGRVVGVDGTLEVGAFRAVGDTTGAFSGPGLLNPFKAEIHLAVRSHGPAMLENPPLLADQLSLFTGACDTNTCVNLRLSRHQP